eukprot:s2384_g4.t1
MVSLLRSDREALNWLLLGPDPTWLRRRGTSAGYPTNKEQLVVPGSPGSPGESTVLPASPQSPEPESPPETPEKAPPDADVVDPGADASPLTPRPNLSFEVLNSAVRFSGPLLKRSGAWHGFWQLRWFQVRGGSLLWWGSPELVGQEPAGALPLRHSKMRGHGGLLLRDYSMFLSWRIAIFCLPLGRCMVMELQHQQHQQHQQHHQLSAVGLQPYQESMTRMAQEIDAGLEILAPLSKGIAIVGFTAILAVALAFCLFGLPKKSPQHESVKDGCPKTWVVFMGLIYTFTYFTTDQYTPSLPQMGIDLLGSQGLMSASIQMNFVVKATAGILTASLSDRIGRRPAILFCLSLLSAASLCCACADHIEWFLLGRLLQGLGESIEPVIFAMARDYFPEAGDRFTIIALLAMMSTFGELVAPVFGGFTAQIFSWRFSFVILAILWGFMAIYAALRSVESCPDGELQSYWGSWKQFLNLHLWWLLLTEACNMAAYMVFFTNISYVVEHSFHRSTMLCSGILLTFCASNALGLLVVDRLKGSLLVKAKITVTCYASSGIVMLLLGAFSSQLWAYCAGAFLSAWPSIGMLVSVNVLYFEPLKENAGLAASLEILAKSVPPSIYSVWSTQALIHSGVRAVMEFQAAAVIASGLVFWCYAVQEPKSDSKASTGSV